ncbi:component of the spliceosome [Scheffersomyces coipomensis]|uniref:component of the spliceosome n=1 Tax=Scheffersomyces coipomensis TaxID=1788519 RepID=UPI00315DE131
MFSSLLPPPKHSSYTRDSSSSLIKISKPKADKLSQKVLTLPQSSSSTSSAIIQTNQEDGSISKLVIKDDGSIDYSQTIALANNKDNRSVQTTYEDTIPLKKRYPNLKHHFPRYTLQTCPDDSIQNCVDETKDVITNIMNAKLGITKDKSKSDVNIIKYTSNDVLGINNDEREGRPQERIIQVREYMEDPMLPPKFKLRKNRHKNPSPPPPILKNVNASESKITKEDREKWKIPAAISNWKNNQGFTISLDKRIIAANGGSETEIAPDAVNIQKFGELSNALEQADKQAREDLIAKRELAKQKAIEEKAQKELQLKQLASLSQHERKRHQQYDSYEPTNYKRHK